MVCARCVDWLTVYNALMDRAIHVSNLETNQQYDEALACLDEILERNRLRDHEKWLERSIAFQRAFILWRAGRNHEALQVLEAKAQLGFERIPDRWEHGEAVASSLAALGRHEEALAVFEEAFSHQVPAYFSYAAYFFPVLVKLSKKVDQPVNEKWRSVALGAAEDFAIKMPARKTLAETLLVITKKTRGMPSKRQREWKKNNANSDES